MSSNNRSTKIVNLWKNISLSLYFKMSRFKHSILKFIFSVTAHVYDIFWQQNYKALSNSSLKYIPKYKNTYLLSTWLWDIMVSERAWLSARPETRLDPVKRTWIEVVDPGQTDRAYLMPMPNIDREHSGNWTEMVCDRLWTVFSRGCDIDVESDTWLTCRSDTKWTSVGVF